MKKATLKQAQQVLNLIAHQDMSAEQLQKFLESGLLTYLLEADLSKVNRGMFLRALKSRPIITTYMVALDYNMSLEEMIWAGKYEVPHASEITQENFPHKSRGIKKIKVHLVHFERYLTTKQVEEELDKCGLKSATLPELCALGATQPHLQLEFPIVALGSQLRHKRNGHMTCPVLREVVTRRSLDMIVVDHEDGWHDGYHFLAVSK